MTSKAGSAFALASLLVLVVVTPARAQLFRRPVACADCITNWYYFDHDRSAGTQDWSCGSSTYDGHRGTDFVLAGGNDAIANGYDVVAVADGVVRSSEDGFFDHCSSCPAAGADPMCGLGFGNGYGNHVVVDHGTHTVYYGHMRTGSVRVAPGDHVTCGQTLGQIGSSGCAAGAHLHLEVRPLGGASVSAFDPFAGACATATPSLWVSQGAYRDLPAPTCDPTSVCATDGACPREDAAASADAGPISPSPSASCACRAQPARGASWAWLLSLVALRRRRSRAVA